MIRRLRQRLRDERGFTLIEMVIVVAILGTVLGGITTAFVTGTSAELNVNNRFQAQEAARLGLAAVRLDVHAACAGSVNAAKTQLTLSIPAGVDPTKACGAAGTQKIMWCVNASPTVPATRFALYRSANGSCNSSPQLKLVADNLVNSLAGFVGFFSMVFTNTVPVQIIPGQLETVDVDIPVSLKVGKAGVPFDLKERMALQNGVFSFTSGTGCSPGVTCYPGPCHKLDSVTLVNVLCYPPPIT